MHINLVFRFLLIVFVCNSCQKEFKEPIDKVVNTKVNFEAKINGIQFVATVSGAVRRNDGVISIAGESYDMQTMVFTVRDSGVHTYTLDMYSSSNFAGYTDANNLAFATNDGYNPGDAGGKLTINLIDTIKRVINGTFNFKVFHEPEGTYRIITEGAFNNVPY